MHVACTYGILALGSSVDSFSSFLPESDWVRVRGTGAPLALLEERETQGGRRSSVRVSTMLLPTTIASGHGKGRDQEMMLNIHWL